MKKIILNSPKFKRENSLIFPVLLLFTMFHFVNNVDGQSNIDSTYSFVDSFNNNIDLNNKVDYTICKSNRNDSNYIAATSFKNFYTANFLQQIRIIEFGKNGNIVKSKIIGSPALLNYVVTDIENITLPQIGYVLTGYIDPLSALQPMNPFIVIIDSNFNIVSSKIIQERGMFSRIGIAPSGNFVCVGYKGDSTDANSTKVGLIASVDFNLTVVTSFVIPTAYISQSYTNLNDLKVLNNNESIITGSLMQLNNGCIEIRTSLIKINHNTGIITWQNNDVGIGYTNPKIEIFDNKIFLIVSAENPSTAGILKYDNLGNFIGGASFESSPFYNCIENKILSHIPYCQNIKYLTNDTILVTGKFVLNTEFMFDVKIFLPDSLMSDSWQFVDGHANYTIYQSSNTDLTGYHQTFGANSCINAMGIQPIYSTDNTIFLLNSKIPVTVTYTHLLNTSPNDFNKTWTFTHGYSSAYGYKQINFINAGKINPSPSSNFIVFPNSTHIIDFPLKTPTIFPTNVNCPNRGFCCH